MEDMAAAGLRTYSAKSNTTNHTPSHEKEEGQGGEKGTSETSLWSAGTFLSRKESRVPGGGESKGGERGREREKESARA
eukprot:3603148-Rhodomonas_salina.2